MIGWRLVAGVILDEFSTFCTVGVLDPAHSTRPPCSETLTGVFGDPWIDLRGKPWGKR